MIKPQVFFALIRFDVVRFARVQLGNERAVPAFFGIYHRTTQLFQFLFQSMRQKFCIRDDEIFQFIRKIKARGRVLAGCKSDFLPDKTAVKFSYFYHNFVYCKLFFRIGYFFPNEMRPVYNRAHIRASAAQQNFSCNFRISSTGTFSFLSIVKSPFFSW